MSCYEWERGTIKLPSKAFPAFRKAINTAANTIATARYEDALRVFNALKDPATMRAAKDAVRAANKTRAPKDRIKLNSVTTRVIFDAINDGWDSASVYGVLHRNRWQFRGVQTTRMVGELGIFERKDGKIKLVKPKKPKKLPLNTTSYRVGSEADIVFDPKSKTVTWSVGENNHACDRAREHELGKAFFRELGRVEWTRGSGGKIVGNDEYNRDSRDEGGGGNILKDEFGPNVRRLRRRSPSWW